MRKHLLSKLLLKRQSTDNILIVSLKSYYWNFTNTIQTDGAKYFSQSLISSVIKECLFCLKLFQL